MTSEDLLTAKKIARRLLGITFLPGDRVRALYTTASEDYIKGEIYTVKSVWSNQTVYTELDNEDSSENGWMINCFELVGDHE